MDRYCENKQLRAGLIKNLTEEPAKIEFNPDVYKVLFVL